MKPVTSCFERNSKLFSGRATNLVSAKKYKNYATSLIVTPLNFWLQNWYKVQGNHHFIKQKGYELASGLEHQTRNLIP